MGIDDQNEMINISNNMQSLKAYVLMLADEIEKAPRTGSDEDNPEGIRYILISDTLAQEIVKNIREKAMIDLKDIECR